MSLWPISLFLFVASSQPAFAQYHQAGSDLVCSDCHTMHYSEDARAPSGSEAGGPFGKLLKASTVNKLCLLCHDGTDTTAPDVLAPVNMYVGSGDEHSCGGYFENSGGVAGSTSHDLAVPTVPPLSTGLPAMTLTCTSCHDPHGSSNYRNLLANPVGGGGTTVVLGTDVFQNEAPALPPRAAASVAAYRASNVGYRSNYSKWCAECHNLLATNAPGSGPAHFQRHPVDVAVNATGAHTDPANWTALVPDGVQTGEGATGDGSFGIPRVRFQAPTASNFAQATTVAASNQVFCGSCHMAHGWKFKANLVLPHKEGGTDSYAGCSQCHDRDAYRETGDKHGGCIQCHTQHASGGTPRDFSLLVPDDNALCTTCHAGSHGRAWTGGAQYDVSGHGTSTAPYPPATGRQSKLCVQCHDPHGKKDATNGLYPSLLGNLEEGGCYNGCHGNVPANRPTNAVDIYTQFTKSVKHPVTAKAKVHTSTESQSAGWNPASNRHVECVDCHNPHRAKPGTHTPPGNTLSNALVGTWGVEPTFGAAWSQPTVFTVKNFTNDPPLSTDKEYQLCLKCHSYFAYTMTPPSGYTDQATEFNPNNSSYHMVVASSRSAGCYPSLPLVTSSYPWTSSSTMYCSDCHSQETTTSALASPRGAHGSGNSRLLWGAYDGTTGAEGTQSHLCFKCHDYNAYVTGSSTNNKTGFSSDNFGHNLHEKHMKGEDTRCWNCHVKVPHGWKWPHMLAQKSDQPNYPAYYGSATGQHAGHWVNVVTWSSSGNWQENNCSTSGCH